MRHLSEGVLRRLHDDRFALSNHERAHLEHCNRCRQRMDQVVDDAAYVEALFAPLAEPPAQVEPALIRLRQHVASGSAEGSDSLPAPRRVGRRRWALGLVAAPMVAAALVVTASAAGWLTIFSPTKVAPITLTASDLSGLPDLSGYGRMSVTGAGTHVVGDAQQAAAATGLTVLRPSSLPSDIPTQVRWQVVDAGNATFTLDAAAAAAAATASGHIAPNIPSGLDGASVTVRGGPAVVAVYGAAAGTASGQDAALAALPTLVIAESARPTASTNGATLQQLEDFLLAQPNLSPQLAAEIRAIGQPASTLPVPVISGAMTSRTITINGVQGVVTGDSSGLVSAVIWEKAGVVYVVGGLLPQSEAVTIAQSLR